MNPDSNIYKADTFKTRDISIELKVYGEKEFPKVSYPAKHGVFSRLETSDFIFEFNQNHEIRHARSKKKTWRHPSEWLKRTIGNDWIYYSTGGYSGVYEAIGEYYLPNLMYETNSLIGGKPFKEEFIDEIVKNWYEIVKQIPSDDMSKRFASWINKVQQQTPAKLKAKAEKLFEITGSRVSVMPPDARHVDYNIIPVNISDGCLYKCQFCKIKNQKKFKIRSQENIESQIKRLKLLYNKDIVNFNALFLGEHDALNAPKEVIFQTIENAYDSFKFKSSYMKKNTLFIFGSVNSLLNADKEFFSRLNKLDFQAYINIGLESYDQVTLDLIGKPVTREKVGQAFKKIQKINLTCHNIEITSNFVMDESLPSSHYDALMELVQKNVNQTKPKGSIYLSPLKFGSPSREILYDFYKFKAQSRFPTFLYIIQRL